MSLKLEIFLPNETVNHLEQVEELVTLIGDLISKTHGNLTPDNDFDLKNLNSFIIIKDEELPAPENFENMDMYLVIPIKE